jgi:hypothetical protein
MHLEVRDKRIRIGGRTEPGRRQVHSSETKGRWNQHGCGFSIRTEGPINESWASNFPGPQLFSTVRTVAASTDRRLVSTSRWGLKR